MTYGFRVTHELEMTKEGIRPVGPEHDGQRFYYNLCKPAFDWLEKKLNSRTLFFYALSDENQLAIEKLKENYILPKHYYNHYYTLFKIESEPVKYYDAHEWGVGPLLNGPLTFDIDDNRLDDPLYQKIIENDWNSIFIPTSKVVQIINSNPPGHVEGVVGFIPTANIISNTLICKGQK